MRKTTIVRSLKRWLGISVGAVIALSVMLCPVSAATVSAPTVPTAKAAPSSVIPSDAVAVTVELYDAPAAQSGYDLDEVCRVIGNGWRNNDDVIDVSRFNIPAGDIAGVHNSALFANPDCFYLDRTFDIGLSEDKAYIAEIYPIYTVTPDVREPMIKEYEAALDNMLSSVDDSMTDFAKALTLHDMLALNCEYDSNLYNGTAVPDASYTAYGALVNRAAVCQGYTLAYIALLDRCGIHSSFAESDEMNHVWNMVRLDGKYYHVDVTWDDSRVGLSDSVQYNVNGYVSHAFFLMSDECAENREHHGWVSAVSADSDRFDELDFKGSTPTQIYARNGSFYYFEDGNLVWQNEATGESSVILSNPDGKWNYQGNSYTVWDSARYARLAAYKDTIWFTTVDSVKQYDIKTGAVTEVAKPELQNNECLYGLAIVGDSLVYDKQCANVTPALIQNLPLEIVVHSPDYGDVNVDGKINIEDVLALRGHLAGAGTDIDMRNADANGDGSVNISDVLLIRQHLAGMDVEFGKAS